MLPWEIVERYKKKERQLERGKRERGRLRDIRKK
jgi:hypothetical protein